MTDVPPLPPDEHAMLLAVQEANAEGIPVLNRVWGMVEHQVSKRRYVVETVDLGPSGMLQLWAPPIHARAHLAALREAEYQARTGLVRGVPAGMEQALAAFRKHNRPGQNGKAGS